MYVACDHVEQSELWTYLSYGGINSYNNNYNNIYFDFNYLFQFLITKKKHKLSIIQYNFNLLREHAKLEWLYVLFYAGLFRFWVLRPNVPTNLKQDVFTRFWKKGPVYVLFWLIYGFSKRFMNIFCRKLA